MTLREARKALIQARSDALLNEKTWDNAGRRALASEQTFAERAATGYYGNKAKDAADRYASAVKARDQIPQWTQVDDWQEYQYPVNTISREIQVTVRLRLVEVATAKLLCMDNQTTSRAGHADTQIEGDAVHNVTAKSANLKDPRELIGEAVEKVLPALELKGHDLLANRSAQFLGQARQATGDAKTTAYVRYLFDSASECNEKEATAALSEVFGNQLTETGSEACRQLAVSRLNLRFRAPVEPAADTTAKAPTTAPAEAVAAQHPATRPALPDAVIASSGRQPKDTSAAQPRSENQKPAVAQWPGQNRAAPTPMARADQPRNQPAAKSTAGQRKAAAAPAPPPMKPAPAAPVPLPPPSDRAADMDTGRVYQGRGQPRRQTLQEGDPHH